MAYATGSATSQEDLMNALNTFAVAQGWTSDIMSTTNDWLALNNGSVYVQFRWDNSAAIAMFQSTGFVNTSTAPGNHTNDDGCGQVDASAPYNSTITAGRRINVGNGPYTSYHFFTDNTTKYIHVVLEYSPGLYRHFSFGTIEKKGTWTGGQYAVNTHWIAGAGIIDQPQSSNHRLLWDGAANAQGAASTAEADRCGSMRLESFSNQTGSMRWGVFTLQTTTLGTDRGGNNRIQVLGGVRGCNPDLEQLGNVRASLLTGHVPLIKIPIWWYNSSPTPNTVMLLGYAPDVRHLQMANFSPADAITVGGDTWMVFPGIRKQRTLGTVEESWNMGIAYKKVV